MKKYLFISLIVLCFSFFGLTTVLADDEDKFLLIFPNGAESLSFDSVTGEPIQTNVSDGTVTTGDQITFEAKLCPYPEENVTTGTVTIYKSNCSNPTSPTWSSSVPGVLSLSSTTTPTVTATVGSTIPGTTRITVSQTGYESYYIDYYIGTTPTTDPTTPTTDPTTPTTSGDNWKRLFVVDDKVTKVSLNGDSQFGIRIERKMYVGDTLKFTAIVCSDSDATVSGETKTWNVSQCTTLDNSKVTWETAGDNEAFSINSNGVVKALKKGFGFTPVYARVSNSDISLGENEYFNNAHNVVVVSVLDAIYTSGTDKKEYTDENDFVSDVYVDGNPETGIEDYVMYLVPLSLIAGSTIAFKRRFS